MASSSGVSSGSSSGSLLPSCGYEEDLHAVMKQKRKLSNRESARRSRMRKQKHLDDLVAQMGRLRKENHQILTALNITTHNYLAVDAENSVLRTRTMELSSRLSFLNEILFCMDGNDSGLLCDGPQITTDSSVNPPWNLMYIMNQLPIMASADMFPDCWEEAN